MEKGEPRPYGLELRRFLLSSSSSSNASSSPTRQAAAAAAKATTAGVRDASSTSPDASSASATSARNFSNHFTPAQTRLHYTTEKVVPEAPSPEVLAERRQRRRSGSSDSVESHDSVDALASSAFQNRDRAAGTLLSARQLLSFADTTSAVSVNGDDERVAGRGGCEVQHANGEAAGEEPSSAPAEVGEEFETPSSIQPRHPVPHPASLNDEDASLDTTSSSRRAVGVWNAIYGKEKWSGSRRSHPREELTPEDTTMSNTEDRDRSRTAAAAAAPSPPAAAVAAPTPLRSEERSATSAATSRHADSSQWAATRQTALKVLRAQLGSSEGHTAGASEQPNHRRRPVAPPAVRADQHNRAEEPTIIEASAQEEAGVARMKASGTPAVRVAAEDAAPHGRRSHDPHRTAEEVLEHLFSGVPPKASDAHRDEAASNGLDDSEATSPFKSSRFVLRPTLSAEVSGISPIKNEAPSILVDLYDSPGGRPARRTRTPIETAVARAVGASTPTSPLSPHMEDHRPQQGRGGWAGDQEEYTLDMSAMDFRTVQTASSSSSSSDVREPPVWPNDVDAVASAHSRRSFEEEDLDAAAAVGTAQGNPASTLRTDSKISVFPAAASNAWDAALVKKQRSKEPPKPSATQGAVAPELSSPAPNNSSIHRNATPAAVRQERVRQEMRAKELAECSFHPTLSPGTRAMVRVAQEREMEKSLVDSVPPPPPSSSRLPTAVTPRAGGKRAQRAPPHASAQPSTSPALDPRTLKATLQNVYERLYPVELTAAASRRQILDQEMEYRRLAREELIVLQRRAGVVRRGARSRGVPRAQDSFNVFMSNILQTDWGEHVAVGGRGTSAAATAALPSSVLAQAPYETVPVFDTSYMSPMAVALREEKEVKRKYNSRREEEMQLSHLHDSTSKSKVVVSAAGERGVSFRDSGARATPPPEDASAEESFRITLFDEFLLRQNAHYFSRARAVLDLERQLTPAFTPTTTRKSARLVKELVSRSLVNESMGAETSSLIAQRQRRHIPIVSSSFVTPHQSPYKDPCTFQPQLSPAARAERAAERRKQRLARQVAATTAATVTPPCTDRKDFFERLYGERERMERARAKAKKVAAEEEMEGVTFKPQLNSSHNAQVKSVLDPKNYEQYQQYLQQQQQSLEAQRQARLEKSEEAEEVVCTFRPQTTKTPGYISKMAKSFGVLRQQGGEV
ncbi:hypothetical protein ABB37_01218 [Leptomonas pyrrhocoris]|uniref:Uncharacterized protein n=1 Tax=Leptomonas pyrrhocoris TaxID=157538 RepID=A0A0M9G8J9_LEPPY|nr:hypothetical protein ABB37_01218 [Leptomonas pyrrhocoris]KPA84716.1 hypothetical protein ABB37_01218 [Leptomonas pyrrhocoris]|eukprot:XP_015663155.1 hypothetical protein ABB37_01218 [Leptomonas pyrrhocoris]